MEMDMVVGSRIKFRGEKQRFTVQARSDRFVICTKPFNPKRSVIYTIIDFERDVRGRDNMIFGHGYQTRADCEERLRDLVEGRATVSLRHRGYVDLDIEDIRAPAVPTHELTRAGPESAACGSTPDRRARGEGGRGGV